MIRNHNQLAKGLDIIRSVMNNQQEDPFINYDSIVDMVDFLKDYVLSHKVEMNNSISEYFTELEEEQ